MPWDVSILSYRISKMYIVGQRIRARLPPNFSPLAFQSVPSFFLPRSSFRQSEFPFDRKASQPTIGLLLPAIWRIAFCLLSSDILCYESEHTFWPNRTFFVLSALSTAYILHRYICHILSVIFEISSVSDNRHWTEQLWRVLITYSISQQPRWCDGSSLDRTEEE